MFIIYDATLKKKLEITEYDEMSWHELYLSETGGDFIIKLSIDYKGKIKQDYYIQNTEGTKTGIVNSIYIKDDEKEQYIEFKGVMLESMLQRRIVYPTVRKNGALSAVTNELLIENIINPKNPNRKISNFIYEVNSSFSQAINKQITGKTLAAVIKNICLECNCSYEITLNSSNQFVFRFKAGENRKLDVIFSDDKYDIITTNYEVDASEYCTHIISTDTEHTHYSTYPATSNNFNTGINRRELYVETNISNSEKQVVADAVYFEKLNSIAAEEYPLHNISKLMSFDIRNNAVNSTDEYVLNVTYKNGDLVTINNNSLRIREYYRILGVLYFYNGETSEIEYTLEFGDLGISDSDVFDEIVNNPNETYTDTKDIDKTTPYVNTPDTVIDTGYTPVTDTPTTDNGGGTIINNNYISYRLIQFGFIGEMKTTENYYNASLIILDGRRAMFNFTCTIVKDYPYASRPVQMYIKCYEYDLPMVETGLKVQLSYLHIPYAKDNGSGGMITFTYLSKQSMGYDSTHGANAYYLYFQVNYTDSVDQSCHVGYNRMMLLYDHLDYNYEQLWFQLINDAPFSDVGEPR